MDSTNAASEPNARQVITEYMIRQSLCPFCKTVIGDTPVVQWGQWIEDDLSDTFVVRAAHQSCYEALPQAIEPSQDT